MLRSFLFRSTKHHVSDTWLRVVGIGLFSFLTILVDDDFGQPLTGRLLALFGFQIVSITLYWHLNRAIATYCRYYAFSHLATASRLALTLLTCMLATAVLAWCLHALRYGISHGHFVDFISEQPSTHISLGNNSFQLNAFGIDFFHSIFVALFYVTVYELVFHRQDSSRYKTELAQSEQEREKLRVANLQSQLDVLKSQVNPHFLFNALNTLSSLISEDPRQAEVFVDKLSGVYRYVLRSNRTDGPEQQMTTLSSELEFIEAYYHLLQTRYGAGLHLTVAVREQDFCAQLPPLTLQLLVENAVKHNVISPKRPLQISIQTDENGRLVVRNNRQLKTTSRSLSNGVGLSNIVAKYQMLDLSAPSVEESEEEFVVRLPMRASSSQLG